MDTLLKILTLLQVIIAFSLFVYMASLGNHWAGLGFIMATFGWVCAYVGLVVAPQEVSDGMD